MRVDKVVRDWYLNESQKMTAGFWMRGKSLGGMVVY